MRRELMIGLGALTAIAAGVVWYLGRGSSSMVAEAPRAGAASGPAPREEPTARGDARARRDALRERIARQLERAPAAPAEDQAAPAAPAEDQAAPAAPAEPRRHPALRDDRATGRLFQAVKQDFVPLARECIEQARARAPQLAGTLALRLEAISDEQLGAVIEAVEPSGNNSVLDPLLLECARESAFSLTLPPSLVTGRKVFEIRMRVGTEPAPDAPP